MLYYLAVAVLVAGGVGFTQVEERDEHPLLTNPRGVWLNSAKLLALAIVSGIFWPVVLSTEVLSYLSSLYKDVFH